MVTQTTSNPNERLLFSLFLLSKAIRNCFAESPFIIFYKKKIYEKCETNYVSSRRRRNNKMYKTGQSEIVFFPRIYRWHMLTPLKVIHALTLL